MKAYVHTANQNAAGSENLRRGRTPELQRRRRLNHLAHEQAEAKKLEAHGYQVFSPTVVCDRIAVKDGRVYFVEFKKPGQVLATGQAIIQALMPENYIVVYADTPTGRRSRGKLRP